MKNLIAFATFLAFANFGFGQGWFPSGARSMSMANASTSTFDVWSYHNNPGAVAKLDRFTAGVSYENRFLLKELQSQGVAVAIPMKFGVISIGGLTYGHTQFRSTKAGVGYSMPLSEKFYAGVQLNYQGVRFAENYGSDNSVTGEAGIYADVTENWSFGFSVFNLGRTRLSAFEDDRYSTIMRLGSAYTFSDKLMVSTEFEKSIDYDLRFKSGIEYEVLKNFYLRGGFATAPVEITFGTGYDFGAIQLDVGSAYHPILGWSPHFSLSYSGNEK